MKFNNLWFAIFVSSNLLFMIHAGISASIPSGIVCAQTLCPTASEIPTCPSTCSNGCAISDDVCCPGIKRAVCNSKPAATTAITTSATTSNTAPTITANPNTTPAITTSPNTTSTITASPNTTATSKSNTLIQPLLFIITVTICLIKFI